MIKQPGVFSQRYLMRKSKENTMHPTRDSLAGHANKENTNQLNNHPTHVHPTTEHDFPLAYTSAKTHSRERTSVSANRKQDRRHDQKAQQQLEEKTELIGKLQRELKESREQTRRLAKEAQAKYSQYDTHINELNEELREKEEMLARASHSLKKEIKGVREDQSTVNRYKETIKGQIYWLLGLFKTLHEQTNIQSIRKEVSTVFMGFKDYISEFAIQKQLQELANTHHPSISAISNPSPSLSVSVAPRNAADSIFTEDLQQVNMIKIMELQPLIETFNNQQYCAGHQEELQNKMERVTKRLFSQSKFVGDSNNCSLMQEDRKFNHSNSPLSDNEFLPQNIHPPQNSPKQLELPHEVTVNKNFDPDSRHENYIKLRKGDKLKLLRKIRDQLWIGEVGEKIGLVSQEYFDLE